MSARLENVRYELKALARETIWLLNRHEPGPRRNIILHATRRGGSTWVMEVIAANRGVKPLDQPFELLTANLTAAQFRLMPKFDSGMIIHLDPDEEVQFKQFADRVLDGSLPVNAPTRFWKPDFDFRSDRLVLKVMAAKSIIDWLATTYDVHTVYLTRHPIAQALSCIRNGWTLTASAFLRNQWFVSHHLDDDLVSWSRHTLAEGTPLERFVLNWALENLVPLRLLPEHPEWLALSYEECVLQPESTIHRLAASLDLHDIGAMMAKVTEPSKSSRMSTVSARHAIATGERESLVTGWRRSVSPHEERSAYKILERLGIDAYGPDQVVPDHAPA